MKTNNPPRLSFGFAACLLGVALAAPLGAQTDPASRPAMAHSATALKHADKSFVDDAAKSGQEEVAISQIAVERASNPQVKEFAQMMVSDHTGANAGLVTLAAAKNVMLPAQKANLDAKWSKKDAKNAKEFDKDYMAKMVDDHQDAVKLFEKEAKHGTDPELIAFATKTLPKLEEHLNKAKEIKKSLK